MNQSLDVERLIILRIQYQLGVAREAITHPQEGPEPRGSIVYYTACLETDYFLSPLHVLSLLVHEPRHFFLATALNTFEIKHDDAKA